MPILKVRDNEGNVSEIKALVGRQGDSAYEIAKQNGFTGTKQEWLESLKAKTPVLGTDYWTDSDKQAINNYIDQSIYDSTNEALTATNENIDRLKSNMITTKGNETEDTKIIIDTEGSTICRLYTVEEVDNLINTLKTDLENTINNAIAGANGAIITSDKVESATIITIEGST